MASVTINAKTGSTGVRSSVDAFATVRSASSGSTTTFVYTTSIPAGSFQIARGFFNFDLSSITKGSTIKTVTFVHPVVSSFLDQNTTTLYIVSHTGSDPIVGGDYDQITLNSPTTFGSLPIASLSTTVTTNISLNSDGIALVQTALRNNTVAKLAIRSSLDVNNVAPSGFNEYVIVPTDVQLIITYTPPSASFLFNLV